MAIIINTLAAPHTFCMSPNKKEPTASMELLVLQPGINELSTDDDEAKLKWAKDLKDFQEMVENEQLIEVMELDKEGVEHSLKSLSEKLEGLDVPMACKLVGACVKTDVLSNWGRNERRSKVKEAIDKQLVVIRDYEKRAATLI